MPNPFTQYKKLKLLHQWLDHNERGTQEITQEDLIKIASNITLPPKRRTNWVPNLKISFYRFLSGYKIIRDFQTDQELPN
jgi:hypothetical protein